jgi:TatD DNase family protein
VAIIDTHCHLDFHVFDEDREAVLARALAAGVERILNPGIDLVSSRLVVHLAQRYPQVFAAVGVHPNEAMSWEANTYSRLKALATENKVVAIGEIGLDYYRERALQAVQKEAFQAQLDLATEMGLPVIVHNREASTDLLAMLIEWQAELKTAGSSLAERPGVLHSFSADLETARQAIAIGFKIGFTGPVTFRNAQDLQQTAAALPVDCLLTETDAPFLTPHPHRGRRNEPAFVQFVLEKLAALHHLPAARMQETISANAASLFHW